MPEEEFSPTEEEHWTSSTMGRDRPRESFSLLTPLLTTESSFMILWVVVHGRS